MYRHCTIATEMNAKQWQTVITLHLVFFFLPGFYVSQRYLLTFMGFLGLVMAYSMRLSLSVAITQMVPPPIFNMANLTTINGEAPIICPFQDENYIHEHFDYQAIFDTLYSVCVFWLHILLKKSRFNENKRFHLMCKFFGKKIYSIWKLDNTPEIIQSENYSIRNGFIQNYWLELNDQLRVNCVNNLDGAFAF